MKSDKKGISHFLSSFAYSMSGAKFMIKETAFQHELILGLGHIALLVICPLSLKWIVFLSALYILILIVEVLNTAIETIVDMVSPNHNALAKKAKDLGSFSVFLSLTMYFFACFVWLLQAL